MTDDLLDHYDRELKHLRSTAAAFAEAHPTIASRLRLSAETIDDPHVGRLLEGVAFLNARIRRKLDDDFPELTDALLGVLYPHTLAPVPSMAIAQMTGQSDLTVPFTIAAGAGLETEAVGDRVVAGRVVSSETCRYRTTETVTLWPVSVAAASLTGRPVTAPQDRRADGAVAVLRLTLKGRNPDARFTTLGLDTLRFYLSAPTREALAVYQLLFRSTLSVMLADSPNDDRPVPLPADCLRPVGFGRTEGILPYPATSFVGYRLLTEYFAFPQKFLFFDLTGLARKQRYRQGDHLDVFFYLSETVPDLERKLSASMFALGCTPIVNLFRQRAEPIALDGTTASYRIVPDSRRPSALEIHSVDSVTGSDGRGRSFAYQPFYALRHADAFGDRRPLFWHAARRRLRSDETGTELFLSLVDPAFDASAPADQVLSVETTCFNRNLPQRLPFGGGRPKLTLIDGTSEVRQIECLTPPTPTLRPPMREQGRWRLVSHLLLNHLSLADFEQGADALREILKLYDFRDSAETRATIDGITSITCARGTARAPGPDMGVLVRGIDVAIAFDAQRFTDNGLFLFASVLERFLPLYGSINSFTRLTATLKDRPGVLKHWPARTGEMVLL
jgi:type VI secretion system protein ImpG